MSARRRVAASVMLAFAALVSVPESASARERPVVPDVRSITLTTASKGLGAHPTLRWKPARGVTTYVVFIQSTKGQPYWTWRGAETHVRLGGGDETAVARSEGAALTRPRDWFVLGLDGSGAVVAASARRHLEP